MSEQRRDRLVGLVVFIFAVAWTVIAYMTIRPGFSGSIVGPRDFPIGLGVLLAVLSAMLFASTFIFGSSAPQQEGPADKTAVGAEIWAVGWTVGALIGYALVMEWFGFIPATVVMVAVVLRFALAVSSPVLLIAMPIGLALGVYFLMGRLMGVYLPRGTLIQLF
jgi:putative tricarboxylic transport membrane protein